MKVNRNFIRPQTLPQNKTPKILSSKKHYYLILSSIIVSSILFYWLKQFYSPLFLLKKIPAQKIPYLSGKTISGLHACLAVLFSSLYLTQHISQATWYKWICLSIGFFTFEILVILLYVITTREAIEICVHHTILLVILTHYLDKYTTLIARGLLCEITSPLLYTCWYLIKIQHQETLLFRLLSLCTLVVFALARVYNFTNISWLLYKQKVPIYELASFFPIVLMNYYWFGLLLEKAIQFLFKIT